MLYDIRNKIVNVVVEDGQMDLPDSLRAKILENFENLKKSGANIWNGAVLGVAKVDVRESEVNLICRMTDYAHYLYEEKVGCPPEYECRNLSAGCFLETKDGYYVIGELDDTTSFPNVLQTTGGGIDKKDIVAGGINVEHTIQREAQEELNIDLTDTNVVFYNRLSYVFVSGEGEQPGVQVFSKAQTRMTARELEEYFEKYNSYLREHSLEVEFKKLHFLNGKTAMSELDRLPNPKRAYIKPLILADIKRKNLEDAER